MWWSDCPVGVLWRVDLCLLCTLCSNSIECAHMYIMCKCFVSLLLDWDTTTYLYNNPLSMYSKKQFLGCSVMSVMSTACTCTCIYIMYCTIYTFIFNGIRENVIWILAVWACLMWSATCNVPVILHVEVSICTRNVCFSLPEWLITDRHRMFNRGSHVLQHAM